MLGASVAATGMLVLAGCKDNAAPPAGGSGATATTKPGGGGSVEECNALIDDASRTLRKSLQYKTKSDTPGKNCAICAQYTADKYGACGGGCKLITGPVKPTGVCLSFAPLGGDGGAAPAKTPT